MDWLKRMDNAMEYVETHLSDEIDFDQAAKIACCSTYHFQRMFSFGSLYLRSLMLRRLIIFTE
ncbi:hypothetical protein XI25_25115 [Paenibacillus sp. DMB20]|nr:hypothetical protein XI25_25115 [Paenibacillus sp. DMB20]